MVFSDDVDDESEPREIKRAAFFVATMLLFLTIGSLTYEIYLSHTTFRGKKEVVVAQGLGSRAIGALLKQEGVISSKWAFVMYVSLRSEASSLKPGRYEFLDNATIPEIARDLIAGAAREHAITIPEGWTSRDIARFFAEQNIAPEDTAMQFLAHPPEDFVRRFVFLSELPRGAGLEGYLFPDTYRVFDSAALQDIAAKMLENFDRKMALDLRAEISRQKKTIFEIITMASLIEKEVASDQDRAVVSGILWKRLSAGIPLQVDATVVYVRNHRSEIINRVSKISLTDKKIDSPYNTYRYRGLPPGPIANPGLSAIRAAIYPKPSSYLYYLSAPDGRTIFSRTLDEHNAAKAKYLR